MSRRWGVAAGTVVLGSIAVGLWLGLAPRRATANASCHRSTTMVRTGESLEASRLPKGMVVTGGSRSRPRAAPIVYSVPSLKAGPYVSLRVLDGRTLAGLAPSDFTTKSSEVEGHQALLAQPHQVLSAAQSSEVGKAHLYWQPKPGVVIAMETYELAPSAMLYVADTVVYVAGTLIPSTDRC